MTRSLPLVHHSQVIGSVGVGSLGGGRGLQLLKVLQRRRAPSVCPRHLFHVYYSEEETLLSGLAVLPFVAVSLQDGDAAGCLCASLRPPPHTPTAGLSPGADMELAVDGGAVGFGFPRRVDYPHEAVSELLQDHPLRLHLRLVSLLRLLGLLQQTLARGLQHLLRYKSVRQPAGQGGAKHNVISKLIFRIRYTFTQPGKEVKY